MDDVAYDDAGVRQRSEKFLREPRDDGLLVVLVDEKGNNEEQEHVPDDENIRPITLLAPGEAFLPAVCVLLMVVTRDTHVLGAHLTDNDNVRNVQKQTH